MGREMKGQRVWYPADLQTNCTAAPPEELNTDVKPSSLCQETNTTICICSTKDNPPNESATWRLRCGECKFKWSAFEDEVEEAENNENVTERAEVKKKTPKKRQNQRQRIRNKMKGKTNPKPKRRNKNKEKE